MRKATSLTALISFLLLVLNSIVLYIAPHGRITYWADWRFWGLTKTEWGNQHVIIGLLFLLAIFLHTYYNWNPIVAYLKNKARKVRIFTREFNIALLLVIVCTIGAYAEMAPFRWVLTFSESIKDAAAQKYGEPPYGRAEISSLKDFADKMSLDLADSLTRLQNAGIQVEDEQQTLLDIAKRNNTFPQQLYLRMKPEDNSGEVKAIPLDPEKGFGNRRLDDVCHEYGVDLSAVLKKLAGDGITGRPDATIKQIAEENGIAPTDVFTAIRKTAVSDE
ncbi:MAG: DUF4405 domain-containing protein [Deltaproteobacteria bacterium]|nr:DUF4405 domain-containing protein [Deltaproteobacteria bacterium]